VDKRELPRQVSTGTKGEFVHRRIELRYVLEAFQADDEGSIPFTRSNLTFIVRFVSLGLRALSAAIEGTQAPIRPMAIPGSGRSIAVPIASRRR
jgi:hypothetical protein